MRGKLLLARHRRHGDSGFGSAASAAVGGRADHLVDRGDRPADDVGQAVAWLSAAAPVSTAPAQAQIGTEKKEFSPHVLVIPAGSTVSFPNHDPFNHNVFSLSEEAPFDLGLYSRGEARSVTLLASRGSSACTATCTRR